MEATSRLVTVVALAATLSLGNHQARSQSTMSNTSVIREPFGVTSSGQQVDRFTLQNGKGMTVRLITYGAIVTEIHVPDRSGKNADVVLGFDNLRQYETESPYFGCIIGRVAFRTAGARFELDGKAYELTQNNGPHHMHGGKIGLSRVVWQAEPVEGPEPAVKLTYTSPDGDQGYSGTLRVTALHTVTQAGELRIDLSATTDKPTPVNMTHHGYFNLSGAGHGKVLDHVVWIDADRYSVMNKETLPTGELLPVEGTRLDFRKPMAIRARPNESGEPGYDLGYLHARPGGWLATIARASDPVSGRIMEVATTDPALIFYTGNALGALKGKNGAEYGPHSGLCMEPGRLPDSVHHANFPPIILRPGEQYRHTLVYRFGTVGK
jgi:aldose 1-epimerase